MEARTSDRLVAVIVADLNLHESFRYQLHQHHHEYDLHISLDGGDPSDSFNGDWYRSEILVVR